MGLNIRRSSFVSNEQKDPWIFPRMSILSISSNKTDETVFSPRELAKAEGGKGRNHFYSAFRDNIFFHIYYTHTRARARAHTHTHTHIRLSLRYYNYGDNILDEEIFNES